MSQIAIKLFNVRYLIDLVRNRPKNWIGHVLKVDGPVKEKIEGRMEKNRTRGMPRTDMLDELKLGTCADMKRRTKDREKWKSWMPWTCW